MTARMTPARVIIRRNVDEYPRPDLQSISRGPYYGCASSAFHLSGSGCRPRTDLSRLFPPVNNPRLSLSFSLSHSANPNACRVRGLL